MAAQRKSFSMNHPVIVMLAIFAIIAFMFQAGEVLKPLALAILLSFALVPISKLMERVGIPRIPSVLLTVLVVAGGLGFIGYHVGLQLNSLALELPEFEENIKGKISLMQPKKATAFSEITKVVGDVSNSMAPTKEEVVQKVQLVSEPNFVSQISTTVGPFIEILGAGFFILILVLYLMINREDMSDRLIRLFGRGKISLTTRTIEEVGYRISKYLAMFAVMNSLYGLIVGLGLWAFGVQYALVWGVLAAALRFVPYAGPAIAFALPMVFTYATTPGYVKPLEVLGLFAVLEVALNMVLEPVIYGKTTGISALALLVAAMFWTWLWGALGLLMATPLTVCLAVLGKYVPTLSFFATFLREEVDLDPGVRFYQRLLALDQDGATAVIESSLKKHPRAEVFDKVLVPTLSLAERDFARGDIDERDQVFIHRVIREVLDDLSGEPESDLATLSAASPLPTPEGQAPPAPPKVLALPANDATDVLTLKMLDLLLEPSTITLMIVEEVETPLKVVERVEVEAPDVVLISHLPPDGLTAARYLVRRIRARHPKMTIIVGRWDEASEAESAAERLGSVGSSGFLGSLAEARDYFVALTQPKPETGNDLAPTLAGANA
ncbi:AI-2E family transporter [Tundrisphaera lichenicola]|uniref:AI-2E family transporter n=1 Tax=Tundrisphaera lichenicola TaxID=2029860 RepID=UPI003EBE99E4